MTTRAYLCRKCGPYEASAPTPSASTRCPACGYTCWRHHAPWTLDDGQALAAWRTARGWLLDEAAQVLTIQPWRLRAAESGGRVSDELIEALEAAGFDRSGSPAPASKVNPRPRPRVGRAAPPGPPPGPAPQIERPWTLEDAVALRSWRLSRGWSQAMLRRMSGVGLSTISKAERALCDTSPQTIAALAMVGFERPAEQAPPPAPSAPSSLPATRAECAGGPRPCPHVSCRYHLYLDVNPQTGTIKLNLPGLEVWEAPESCALDVADRGGVRLDDVAALLGVSRQRAHQIEQTALARLGPRAAHLIDGDER